MNLDFEKEIADVEQRIAELTDQSAKSDNPDMKREIGSLKRKMKALTKKIYTQLTPWQTVQIARHQDRPLFRDYIEAMCSEFIELHGDRAFGDDHAMAGGLATIDGQRVMLIGMVKGRTVEEKVKNNFGMPNPEGYRKALRLMKLAEKWNLPVVCMIDTPAAYPGREAEERGQAEAIARNLTEMAQIETPIVVVITGEGGSGGALGIAVGDVVLMLSYAVYSVIPPEGCAAILWRDAEKAPDAAEALKLTANSLLELGIIDEIIPEPPGGAHREPDAAIQATREAIVNHVKRLKRSSPRRLVDRRYDKFAKMGRFKMPKSA
jgi:acetyl-CoA carboxylase carboxyl transferase subunit alpha